MSREFANLKILSSFNIHNTAVRCATFATKAPESGFLSVLNNKVRYRLPFFDLLTMECRNALT